MSNQSASIQHSAGRPEPPLRGRGPTTRAVRNAQPHAVTADNLRGGDLSPHLGPTPGGQADGGPRPSGPRAVGAEDHPRPLGGCAAYDPG